MMNPRAVIVVFASIVAASVSTNSTETSLAIVGKRPLIVADASTPFQLRVSNGSSSEIQFWEAGFWPNHQWFVYDATKRPMRPSPAGISRSLAFSSMNRDKNALVVIKSGNSHLYQSPPILGDFDLPNGKYYLKIRYSDRSFGRRLELSTRMIPFVVKRRV